MLIIDLSINLARNMATNLQMWYTLSRDLVYQVIECVRAATIYAS